MLSPQLLTHVEHDQPSNSSLGAGTEQVPSQVITQVLVSQQLFAELIHVVLYSCDNSGILALQLPSHRIIPMLVSQQIFSLLVHTSPKLLGGFEQVQLI